MLEVHDLVTRYGRATALFGLSLKLNAGEVVSLIGANGAGKSTTLKAIAGILPAASGRIVYEGREIQSLPASRRVPLGISLVPEGRQLFGEMTVLENLELGFAGSRRRNFAELLEEAYAIFPKIKERARQLAGTLSGGEQQMAAIARGLMASPKVLMLDEPMMGLAPILVDQVAETIEKLQQKGLTILLVEQHASIALELSSRAYVLENGRVALSGASSELMKNEEVQKAYLGR